MVIATKKDPGVRMNTFIPDLIIEVTSACNRACIGCYAPNVVSNEGALELYRKNPNLFLKTTVLKTALSELRTLPLLTAIRGGEPSLHPEIQTLLVLASKYSSHVMLETHARWLLPESAPENKETIRVIRENNIIVKISFDKMHGMKKHELQKITDFLSWNEIDYRIAITESSLADYLMTRSLCSWIEEGKIIFQQKAKDERGLIKPSIGTINVRGELKKTVNHKFMSESEIGVISA